MVTCDYCNKELVLDDKVGENTHNHLKCVQEIKRRFNAGQCEKCGKTLGDDLSSVIHVTCREYGYSGL